MSPSSTHDIDGVHHRRDAPTKPKEMKPLWTCEPLPRDREKKPADKPPKKRKRAMPTTEALTFHPKSNQVPSGKQDPPVSASTYSRPSTSESSASSYDEEHTTSFPVNAYEVLKRPRTLLECPSTECPTSFYPDTPSTVVSDMNLVPPHDFYDSPESCSSSSPAPSESPCAEFPFQVIPPPMCGYGNQPYVQQPVVHPDHYGYAVGPCADRPIQNYPMQYPDTAYGRPPPHGLPAYPESNNYPYPPGCRY